VPHEVAGRRDDARRWHSARKRAGLDALRALVLPLA
jgi:hypothetical protein